VTRADPSDPRGRVVCPTIVIGLGDRGAAMVSALEASAAARAASGDTPLRLLRAGTDEESLARLARDFSAALDDLLDLGRVAQRRAVDPAVAPVDVFVLARLGAADVSPAVLGPALDALDPGVARHAPRLLHPDGRPRLHVLPLLLLPAMPPASLSPDWQATPEQAEVIAALAALRGRVESSGPGRARLGRAYLVEPGTRTFLLDEAAREDMAVAFLAFLLFGSLRRDAAGYRGAYEAGSDRQPFGSFIVARAELPRGPLARVFTASVAALGLSALKVPRSAALIAEQAASFDVIGWADRVRSEATRASEAATERLVAAATAAISDVPAPMSFLEGTRGFFGRADAPWLQGLEAGLDRARAQVHGEIADGLGGVAAIVERIELDGAAALRAARQAATERLDQLCLAPEADGHHVDALRIVDTLRQRVEGHRERVARAALSAPPEDVGAQPLRPVHREMVEAAARKPEPRQSLLMGAALLSLIALVGAPLLPMLGALFERPGEAPGPLLTLLVEAPWYQVTAAALVTFIGGGWLLAKLRARTRDVNAFLAGESRLGDAVNGTRRRVREQVVSRRDAAVAHGVCRLLTRELDWLARERASLARAEAAVDAQLERQRRILREHAVDADGASPIPRPAASALARSALPDEGLRALGLRVRRAVLGPDAVRALKRLLEPYARRHEVIPFADLVPLAEAVESHLERLDLPAVLADPELGAGGARALADAITGALALTDLGGPRAAGARLHLPLDLTPSASTAAGLDAPRVLARAEVVSALLARPEVAGDPDLRRLLEGAREFYDPDRVFVLQVVWGIAAEAIPWLAPTWSGGAGARVIPLAQTGGGRSGGGGS